MAHSLSWIDPTEFDALVEATAWRPPAPRPVARPTSPAPEAAQAVLPLPPPEAPEADAPVASMRSPSRSTRSVTVAARPKPPAAAAVPPPPQYTPAAPEPFRPPADLGIEERLEHLIAWATEYAGLRAGTVVDGEGLLVAGAQSSAYSNTHSALAQVFCQSRWLDAIGAGERGRLTVRANDETHVLVWETSSRGRLLLSLRGTASPSSGALDSLGAALRGAL